MDTMSRPDPKMVGTCRGASLRFTTWMRESRASVRARFLDPPQDQGPTMLAGAR